MHKKITRVFHCYMMCRFHCSDQPPAVVPMQQETTFVEVHANDALSPITPSTTGTTPLLTPQSQQYPRESLTEENCYFSPDNNSPSLPPSLPLLKFLSLVLLGLPHFPHSLSQHCSVWSYLAPTRSVQQQQPVTTRDADLIYDANDAWKYYKRFVQVHVQ